MWEGYKSLYQYSELIKQLVLMKTEQLKRFWNLIQNGIQPNINSFERTYLLLGTMASEKYAIKIVLAWQ